MSDRHITGIEFVEPGVIAPKYAIERRWREDADDYRADCPGCGLDTYLQVEDETRERILLWCPDCGSVSGVYRGRGPILLHKPETPPVHPEVEDSSVYTTRVGETAQAYDLPVDDANAPIGQRIHAMRLQAPPVPWPKIAELLGYETTSGPRHHLKQFLAANPEAPSAFQDTPATIASDDRVLALVEGGLTPYGAAKALGWTRSNGAGRGRRVDMERANTSYQRALRRRRDAERADAA